MKKFLSEKEILFCRYYANSYNSKESAIKAGFNIKKAEKTAQKLLSKKQIICCLKRMEKKFQKDKIINIAITALQKIIFYRPNDAVAVIKNINNLSEYDIENLDLFQLSEVKKLKDGSFEFKFIDKIKAIEILIALSEKVEEKQKTTSLLKALTAKPTAYDQNE